MTKKGIRIIEAMLRVDKVAEEAALGGDADKLLVMPPIKWVYLEPAPSNRYLKENGGEW